MPGSGLKKSLRVRLAVMDMWKPFRLVTAAHAPQAAILFDKFHILRHLGEALDEVRKSEYRRLAGRDRRYIKSEIHLAVAQGESHARRQARAKDIAFGQQATQHGLCSQGEFWPAVEL